MFGHRWEPARATIVARNSAYTTGDGMVSIMEYVADVAPSSGAPVFRTLMKEPRISTYFRSPSVGDVVRAEADVERGEARFDKDDPALDSRTWKQAEGDAFRSLLDDPPGSTS